MSQGLGSVYQVFHMGDKGRLQRFKHRGKSYNLDISRFLSSLGNH